MSLAYAGKGFAYTTRICEKSVLSQTIGRQHAFFLVDPNALIAGENTLQRFRLSRTTIPVSVNIFQKTYVSHASSCRIIFIILRIV